MPLCYVLYFRVDAFAVTSAKSLGDITKLRVGHDNKGFAAAWYLSKVSKTLRKLCREDIRLYFLGKLYSEHIRLHRLEDFVLSTSGCIPWESYIMSTSGCILLENHIMSTSGCIHKEIYIMSISSSVYACKVPTHFFFTSR